MRTHGFKATLKAAVKVVGLLLFGAVAAFGQSNSSISLTAAPTTVNLPTGATVPMWGYFCSTTVLPVGATCAALNPASNATLTTPATWSPVVITVPYNAAGTSLTISLTNNLSFLPTGATTANTVPTSLTIVGQVGGGLGDVTQRTTTLSPSHDGLVTDTVTWATVGGAPGFAPPPQGPRVQSFATEVGVTPAAGQCATNPCPLTWSNLRPGTYLIESGTHPSIQGPMGLYGILVVTTAPGAVTGIAYPVNGTSTAAAPVPVNYDAEVPLVLSEIDPVQNATVNTAVNTAGFNETTVWSGQPGGCGNPSSGAAYNTCYPPAVNYTPLYYMFNGVAFNKTNPTLSNFSVTPNTGVAAGTGQVLLRVVNAGLRMHVPSIVGSQTTPPAAYLSALSEATLPTALQGFQIVAEDGTPLPGTPRVQNEVLMVPGKVYDLMINAPAAGSAALPIYDRELSLSASATARDGGMLAYISINGGAAGASLPVAPVLAAAVARPDTYNAVVPCTTAPCTPLVVSDPGKGVIANDTNVYGVTLLTAPTSGIVTLNANGTFIYTPNAGFSSDTFVYCANVPVTGTAPALTCSGSSATVTLGKEGTVGTLNAYARTYTANTSAVFALKSPGVLSTQYDLSGNPPDTDTAGFPLSVNPTPVATPLPMSCTGTAGGGTVLLDAEGGFTATLSAPVPPTAPASPVPNCTFNYQAKNSQGALSPAPGATVTINFPVPSGLSVTVLDGYDKKTQITDYRWLIEEDRTFYVNPNCTTNIGTTGITPAGCPSQTATSGVPPIFGVNFATSNMPYVAQGCTGQLSCEGGQTVYDNNPSSPTFGTHILAVCDVGDGVCRPDTTGNGFAPAWPSSVHLDPSKRYYISVFPGDAANPFVAGYAGVPCGQPGADPTTCVTGHGMGGAPIPAACQPAAGANTCSTGTFAPVTILSQPSPYQTAKLSIFVFEDDFPLNGEHDSSGGTTGVNTNNEPGLGQFQVQMWDAFGGNGDFTGQMGFDMFNQPLVNGLAGQIDPSTGKDACPITKNPRNDGNGNTDPTATGITGMMVTCPEYESDGMTPSPLAGQIVVNGLMPGRWGVIAHPGADRIARGEEWLQTNTLDGQKAHDSFTKVGEPGYFQEYGPASFHVSIGFANPAIINSRHAGVCAGTDPNFPAGAISCTNTIKGRVVGERLSRTPDERLYGSGSHDAYSWTQCYVSFGDPDGEDFAFTKCDADGNFTLTNLPDGDWRITTFDQWNDQLVDGLSTPVRLCAGSGGPNCTATTNMGDIATTQWEANLQTKTFIDDENNGLGLRADGTPKDGIPFLNVAVRLRDGSIANLLGTDFTGTANFNETFPLFSWYTVETDVTRYKNTGIHVVYDVGGPADGSPACGTSGYPPCGTSTIGKYLANTEELVSVPLALRVPGAVYCANADCAGYGMDTPDGTGPFGPSGSGSAVAASAPPAVCTTTTATPPITTCSTKLSSGRIDPPSIGMEGWQGFTGQFNFMEFGKKGYAAATATTPAETGGIHGHVEYASTRPFDDPQMLVQVQWAPLVPNVTINLYQEGFAADGVTPTLKLVDTTKTSSFDDWAQGFRHDPTTGALLTDASGAGIPNINCPGQGAATGVIPDLFFFTLKDQPIYLDYYNNVLHGTAASPTPLPNHSQFKCYDGMHSWNQIQPAPYDGAYSFPSVVGIDRNTGRPAGIGTAVNPTGGSVAGSNCTICVPNPDLTDHFRFGTPMLPAGKYVVEVVMPPGYELVKEEDKNILIGDNYIAPVTQEFGGLGNVFIIPDQAAVASWWNTGYNATTTSGVNPTNSFGTSASNNIVPGFVPEPTWPCVGEARVVPDYISLFPQSSQVSPFAGATRNLCDRKEVTLSPQMAAIAKFFIYTSTHIASKFTGGITDDYTSEFDPFSPTFGEKFSPPDMPISIKDWAGNEISRVYADHFGAYNGMVFSSWEVNPPNPTGYAPGMMTFCMNDPGPISDTRAQILSPTGTLIANPNLGKMVTDPLFQEGYSQFCYELPFMPGATAYLDTPVVPTSAFAGAGYNNVDCYYPDATPAVSEVDGDGHIGPWVAASGATLTIHALGDQMVPNYAYTGPQASTAPYNQKTVRRHYGFGATQSNAGLAPGGVTIGGVPATVTSWSDTQIVVAVPSGVPPCPVQQQAQYGGSAAQCGELVITTGAARVGGMVSAVSVTPPPAGNRGGTYTGNPPVAPSVTFNNGGTGGTGAVAHAVLGSATGSVASVTVTNATTTPRNGPYTSAPSVVFNNAGTNGTGASGTAVMRREVTGVGAIGQGGGSYPLTGTINVTFTAPTGAGGVRATGTVQTITSGTPARRHITGVTVTNLTTNSYQLTGTITASFSCSGCGGGTTNPSAVAATTAEFVSAVTVTPPPASNSGGSGYTSAPGVSFTGGGLPANGVAAAATAALSASRTATVVSVVIDNGGSGYTTAPTVTFSGSASTRAIGTVTINGPATVVSGKQSIDTVTVTIGGKAPTHVAASASVQAAIDAAKPGDLIMVDPTCLTTATGATQACPTAGGATGVTYTTAAHNELLIMWKPVRLQGVGAATSIINANTHPAGKLDVWRQKVDCLFGLALNGAPISSGPTTTNLSATGNPFDPTQQVKCDSSLGYGFQPYDESQATGAGAFNAQVDRLPLEAVIGWNSDLNGNLAELLQEPSLMGALEGAGITVLAKGVNFPSDPYDATLLAGFPTGTTLLQNTVSNPAGALCGTNESATPAVPNKYPSNYSCNPSSIDGLGITDSSQGGGGIFIHGWAHNLQVANNRIYNNAGTLSGGINLGQGEFAPAYIQGSATNAAPGSCEESPVANAVLPYCENVNVNIHNNYIALNSSTGDELFSATPAGAGGVSICTGSDYYKFNYNWVCGNLTSGDGGGVGHLGFTYNGDIEHNTIIFNQSSNPTIPANGGGLVVAGAPDQDVLCNQQTNPLNADQDCAPFGAPTGTSGNTSVVGLGASDGSGPGLVINANLIMGNTAESGTGGGVAFQAVNGSDMISFPTEPGQWNSVQFTNNIVADNVGGWDGAGISLYDSPNVNIINSTVVSNASTGSAGILFNTLGGPISSQGGTNGPTSCASSSTTTCPVVAGLVALQHSAVLMANLPTTVTCPPGHFQTTATNGSCKTVSYPKLENNIFWQNNSYYIGVGALSPQFQQNIVTLYNMGGAAVTSQPAADATTANGTGAIITGGTGACVARSYWDIGVRGDTGPTNHNSGVTLTASGSVLTPGASSVLNPGNANRTGNPTFASQYCNGSRVPPEAVTAGLITAAGWAVPPGISDATVPNPVFSLTPAATVDEGNNWVNIAYGPLSLTNPTVIAGPNGNYGGGLPLGNYSIASTSAARNAVTATQNLADAPRYDFFNTQRANDLDSSGPFDAGAVEFIPAGSTAPGGGTQLTVSPALVDFPFVPLHSGLSQDQDVLVTNAGSATVAPLVSLQNSAFNNFSLTPAPDPNGCPVNSASLTLGLDQSCIVNVSFTPETPSTTGLRAGTLTVNGGGVTQTIPLNGHITVGTISIVSTIPNGTLDPTPAATTAVTGTITLGNSENPATDPDAGPWVLTAPPSFTQTGTGTVTLGGTCTTGVNVFPGQTCTITVSYTAPAAPASPTSRITVYFAQGTVLGTQTQGWTANFNVQSNIPAN